MSPGSLFKIRHEASPHLLDLLSNTTLGTNGAKYQHLDTNKRILEADNPLYLSLERNEKLIGNITFCQRGEFWYIRYFAFDSIFQSAAKTRTSDKSNSFLKREIKKFFDEIFEGKHSEEIPLAFYAYIDPRNDRSKWMSKNFGFQTCGHLATQTFSRVNPKRSNQLKRIENWEEIKSIVQEQFESNRFYFESQIRKPPYYVFRDETGGIIALTKVTRVNWRIIQLPGKHGKFLTKSIRYIPVLNKLIKPEQHTFLVPEIVFVKNNDPKLLSTFFSSILAEENLNLMIWWVDINDPLYHSIRNNMKWGILHKILGVNPVDVVELRKENNKSYSSKPVFVSAFDMV